jgi:hypothetical protein
VIVIVAVVAAVARAMRSVADLLGELLRAASSLAMLVGSMAISVVLIVAVIVRH